MSLLKSLRDLPLPVLVSGLILAVFVATAIFGPLLPLPEPFAQNVMRSFEPPSWEHPFGTDQLGRDVLARIVAGSRYSIAIGAGAVAVGLLAGMPLGVFAGYRSGWIDALFTRTIDVLLSFPGIILALSVVAILGPGLGSLIIAVGIRSFPVFGRIARAETIALRERDFVNGARAIGAREGGVLTRHIVPNLMSSVLVVASLQMATAILIGATLTFLGVGISPEVPEWGSMMNAGRAYMLRAPQLILVPGSALLVVMMSLNILSDHLRDRMDPFHVRVQGR